MKIKQFKQLVIGASHVVPKQIEQHQTNGFDVCIVTLYQSRLFKLTVSWTAATGPLIQLYEGQGMYHIGSNDLTIQESLEISRAFAFAANIVAIYNATVSK